MKVLCCLGYPEEDDGKDALRYHEDGVIEMR
jgi:hypothetical protein